MSDIITLITVTGSMFALFIIITTIGNQYSLNRIKNKTVGQGQHGTARWATKREVKQTYKHIDFQPSKWRVDKDSILALSVYRICLCNRNVLFMY